MQTMSGESVTTKNIRMLEAILIPNCILCKLFIQNYLCTYLHIFFLNIKMKALEAFGTIFCKHYFLKRNENILQ